MYPPPFSDCVLAGCRRPCELCAQFPSLPPPPRDPSLSVRLVTEGWFTPRPPSPTRQGTIRGAERVRDTERTNVSELRRSVAGKMEEEVERRADLVLSDHEPSHSQEKVSLGDIEHGR